MKINVDAIGIGASIICAIHCALLPIILIAIPLTGLEFFHSKVLDMTLIGTSFLFGCFALLRGYIKHHHKINAILLFGVGFPILLVSHFFTKHFTSIMLVIVAAGLIITAHWINRRATKADTECIH